MVGEAMRELMGIEVGESWPGPHIDEELLDPRFDKDVNHKNNVVIQNLACKITLDREVNHLL